MNIGMNFFKKDYNFIKMYSEQNIKIYIFY